ncbi:MAG: hypothetical protein K0R71_1579 [Bacillales bacterium]|jgi:uncharacterized protein (DUF2164 family)|nr:hypothetical protein [Bacillales bacterium]
MLVKWDKEIRRKMINEIQEYFYQEKGEEIGDLAAEDFLEFIDKVISKYYYNEGINQAKKLWEQSSTRLEEELFSLKRP